MSGSSSWVNTPPVGVDMDPFAGAARILGPGVSGIEKEVFNMDESLFGLSGVVGDNGSALPLLREVLEIAAGLVLEGVEPAGAAVADEEELSRAETNEEKDRVLFVDAAVSERVKGIEEPEEEEEGFEEELRLREDEEEEPFPDFEEVEDEPLDFDFLSFGFEEEFPMMKMKRYYSYSYYLYILTGIWNNKKINKKKDWESKNKQTNKRMNIWRIEIW